MVHQNDSYRERLRVPVRWWVHGSLFVASFWIALAVAVPPRVAGGIAAASMGILAAGLMAYGRAQVIVENGVLTAGRSRIEVTFLRDIIALDPETTRDVAGPHADARAFLLLRPYLRRAVRMSIDDTRDPTPYWLVSSRHPERLVSALHARTG